MSGKFERPLSPHLQIYRPQLTSVMSILHRATGYALAVGTIMVIWLLIAAATGAGAYGVFIWFINTLIGQLMLFGWTVALFYHLFNGIRHLIWDTGRMFDIDQAYRGGYFVLCATAFMTVFVWWGG